MGILRAETLLRIKEGIKAGIGPTRLYWELRAVGPVTRKTDFLADYRREADTKKKEGLLRFVRKDRYPTTASMAALSPVASREFLYKVKIQSTLYPGAIPTERFVNCMHDVPQTPGMVEQEAWEKGFPQSPPAKGEVRIYTAWEVFAKEVY